MMIDIFSSKQRICHFGSCYMFSYFPWYCSGIGFWVSINTHTNPSTWAGCDTRSVFKRSLTGFNSKISFPRTGSHSKVLKNQFAPLTIHSWKENSWIHAFLKVIRTIWNANCFVQYLNTVFRVHFHTMSIFIPCPFYTTSTSFEVSYTFRKCCAMNLCLIGGRQFKEITPLFSGSYSRSNL